MSGDNIDHAALIGEVARRLWGEPNARLSKTAELRFGTHGSRSINLKDGTWFDHEANEGGGNFDLIKREIGCDDRGAYEWLCAEGLINKPTNGNGGLGAVIANYKYVDERGKLLFEVLRLQPKSFRQRRPDGHGGYLWNLKDTRCVLYGLPDLISAIAAGKVVIVAEGERKVDLLRSWDMVATCCAGGAGKWRADYSTFLRGADVILLPDNDNAGFEHVQKVGASLSGIAKRVRVLLLPGLLPKGDIINWADAGGTADQLRALIETAQDWAPAVATDASTDAEKAAAKAKEDSLIEALARLPRGVEFDRQRKQAAKELGVSRSAIDDEIEERRGEQNAGPLFSHWGVVPWDEPAEGDSLLRDIIRRLLRHVVMTSDDALAIALWIMFAWVHDTVAIYSPILAATSAEPESGKTTTLGLVSFLLPRCMASVEITEAALFRSIKLWSPSFLIDEFDDVLASDDAAGLRSVINSGHTRGQVVVRCVGDERTPEPFSTFRPKAIGSNGRKLPPATRSRCIFIELRRKRRDQGVTAFLHEDDNELGDLRRRLMRWSMDHEEALRTVVKAGSVAMPYRLENRRADNWRVQFAIADLAGEDWGDKARAAAVAIEGKSDSRTAGVRLLAAIQALFNDGEDHPMTGPVSSATLIDKLTADPISEWAEWRRGKPISQRQLADLLKPFHIFPEQVRIGERQVRGYHRKQFEEAWKIYLPNTGEKSSVTASEDQ
jgi:hypothetical protein